MTDQSCAANGSILDIFGDRICAEHHVDMFEKNQEEIIERIIVISCQEVGTYKIGKEGHSILSHAGLGQS